MSNEVECWEELDDAGRDWLAERYVLLDPTLDREAFEAQMAEQLELALAVAAAVARCERLSTVACQSVACQSVASPAVVADEPVTATKQVAAAGRTASVPVRGGWGVWYACGLAIALAGVMIGGSWWRWRKLADATPALWTVARVEGDLTQVAERWLALGVQDASDKDASVQDASVQDASVQDAAESGWDPSEPSPAQSVSTVEVVEDGTPEWSLQAGQLAAADEPDWMLEVAAAFFAEAGS